MGQERGSGERGVGTATELWFGVVEVDKGDRKRKMIHICEGLGIIWGGSSLSKPTMVGASRLDMLDVWAAFREVSWMVDPCPGRV